LEIASLNKNQEYKKLDENGKKEQIGDLIYSYVENIMGENTVEYAP